MRKLRNAAIAGLTAVTLVAGANFATAETNQQDAPGWSTPAADRGTPKPADKCKDQKTNLDEDQVGNADRDCKTSTLGEDIKNKNNSSNSSVWGQRYNANNNVVGTDLLGWEKNFDRQPVWAQIWYVVTVLGVVGTVVGLGVLPVINDMKAKGLVV